MMLTSRANLHCCPLLPFIIVVIGLAMTMTMTLAFQHPSMTTTRSSRTNKKTTSSLSLYSTSSSNEQETASFLLNDVYDPANDNGNNKSIHTTNTINRRTLFRHMALMTATVSTMTTPTSSPDTVAWAFDNKISNKYDDRPKRRGSKPPELGILKRKDMFGDEYLGLKHCSAAPNCFCSTDDIEEDPEHSIPAWIWPEQISGVEGSTTTMEQAFIQLAEVVSSYEPGQSNIDGGGFKIITNEPKKGYLYVQFESLKNGYIDDVEFAYIDGFVPSSAKNNIDDDDDKKQQQREISTEGGGSVQVRSSSRIGYLDYGVNAKRLNYIAEKLRQKGWDAKGVDYKTHQNYAILNELV